MGRQYVRYATKEEAMAARKEYLRNYQREYQRAYREKYPEKYETYKRRSYINRLERKNKTMETQPNE